jgi:hypothetical protein
MRNFNTSICIYSSTVASQSLHLLYKWQQQVCPAKFTVIKKLLCLILFFYSTSLTAQQPIEILKKVKAKIDLVNKYTANGHMKTNISFLKVPEADVKVYFEKPDKLKIVNEKGISLVPKGAVTFNLNNIMNTANFTAIDAGNDVINTIPVKIIKLVPNDENSEIVLSVLYIDVTKSLVLKAKTTSRDNGTFELVMQYGRYQQYALADKIIFSFNTKEYKLPKGLTFDYDDGSKKPAAPSSKTPQKGTVEIKYFSYVINK